MSHSCSPRISCAGWATTPGTIFEIAHPDLDYSLGGGGRYDGMIGRFLGTDVPAAGFSLGFERLVELVKLPEDESAGAIALVYDAGVAPARLGALKAELIASGVARRSRRGRATRSSCWTSSPHPGSRASRS